MEAATGRVQYDQDSQEEGWERGGQESAHEEGSNSHRSNGHDEDGLYIKPHVGRGFIVRTPGWTSWTVGKLKEHVEAQTGVPGDLQRLLFKGKHLRDDWVKLDDLGINDGGIVLLLQGYKCEPKGRRRYDWREKEPEDESVSLDEEPLVMSIIRALMLDESLRVTFKRLWQKTERFWTNYIYPIIGWYFTVLWYVCSTYVLFVFHLVSFFVDLFIVGPFKFFFTLGFNLFIFAFGLIFATGAVVLHFFFIEVPLMWLKFVWALTWCIFVEWPQKMWRFITRRLPISPNLQSSINRLLVQLTAYIKSANTSLLLYLRRVVGGLIQLVWRMYPQKGHTINNYTLAIVPGRYHEEGKRVFYQLKPDQRFGVYLYNDHKFRVNCLLTVDDRSVGVFKMDPFAGYTIKRNFKPHDNEYQYLVFKPNNRRNIDDDSSVGQGIRPHMTVKAKFIPLNGEQEAQELRVGLIPNGTAI